MIGENLRYYRKEKNMSMRDLSKKSNVSSSYISDLENGKNNKPSVDVVEKLADALKIPVTKLLLDEKASRILDDAANEKSDHVVKDIYPLVEYVNKNRFEGKFNIKEEFQSSDLIDLSGLLDDIIANRILHVVNRKKSK